MACFLQSIVYIPIFNQANENYIDLILKETQVKTIACEESIVSTILKLKSKAQKLIPLRHIIQFEQTDPQYQLAAKKYNVDIISFSELIGRTYENTEVEQSEQPTNTKDVLMIVYTQGTNETPKGCIITHQNMICALRGLEDCQLEFRKEEIYLAYLSNATIYDQVFFLFCIMKGTQIAMCSGQFMEDISAVQPNILIGDKKFYKKIYRIFQDRLDQHTGFKS